MRNPAHDDPEMRCPTGKKVFPSQGDADKAIKLASERHAKRGDAGNRPRRSYSCPRCSRWHISSSSEPPVKTGRQLVEGMEHQVAHYVGVYREAFGYGPTWSEVFQEFGWPKQNGEAAMRYLIWKKWLSAQRGRRGHRSLKPGEMARKKG